MKTIFSRFPFSIILIVILTGLGLALTHGSFSNEIESIIGNSVVATIFTFFLGLGIYISSESLGYSIFKRNLIQVIALIFGILFYFSLDTNINNIENVIFIVVSMFGIMSYLFFAPYVKELCTGSCKKSVFYTYFYKISIIFLIAFILGGVLFLLGNIALSTIESLFDFDFIKNVDIYETWGILSICFFSPMFALTQLPDRQSYTQNHFNENQFFSFLTKYIATPFIYLYFIILYAYSIKVLLNFGEWPKGEVTWMVIGFSIFGYTNYIFSYIFEQKNKFIKIFRSIFPYAVVPQIFMLFYAIYLRVAQYDVTINRYFVIVFGLWLLVISCYFILSKKKNLVIIPSILVLFTLLISIGPWGVYSLPETRQQLKLEQNLIQANILQDGKIIPLTDYKDIENSLSTDIYSTIQYLCDFDNCNRIKSLFPDQYKTLLEEYDKNNLNNTSKDIKDEPGEWKITQYITYSIKVKNYAHITTSNDGNSKSIYLSTQESLFPMDIEGYSSIVRLSDDNDKKQKHAQVDIETKELLIYENAIVIHRVDINQVIEKITILSEEVGIDRFNIKEKLSFRVENYMLIFNSLSIPNPKYDGENDYEGYFDGYVLIQ